MAFSNLYSGHTKLNYSKEFNENDRRFVLALSFDYHGVICVDLYGNEIWNNMYNLEGEQQVVFQKIIQVNPIDFSKEATLGFQYIIHAKAGLNHYLISINSINGTLNWSKKINWKYEGYQLYLEPNKSESLDHAFYIALSKNDIFEKDKLLIARNENPFIGKFDYNGNLILGKSLDLEKDNFKINVIHSHQSGLSVAGEYLDKETISTIFELDLANLEIKEGNSCILNEPNITIHDLKLSKNGSHLISGYLLKENATFIGSINFNEHHNNFQLSFMLKTEKHKTKLEILTSTNQEESIYFLTYEEGYAGNGKLHYLTNDFNITWSKTLVPNNNNNTDNRLRNLSFNNETNLITTICHTGDGKYHLISTETDFETCITQMVNGTFQKSEIQITPIGVESKDSSLKTTIFKVINASNSNEKYELCPRNSIIPLGATTSLQSPNFYLQSVGSIGNDSSKGIHSRWIFKGALGDKHLPKGNLAENSVNFNKPDDFVKIYRTKYIPSIVTLDLFTNPNSVDHGNRVWIYNIDNKNFTVYFRDAIKYDDVLVNTDPLIDSENFVSNYGNALIEIENGTELFFAVKVSIDNLGVNSNLQLESLSVEENTINAAKIVSSRNSYNAEALDTVKIICENGRSIRYQANNCVPYKFSFEFYSDFITVRNTDNAWRFIDDFSLSTDNNKVHKSLEPMPNAVHGKWKRFNDDAFVNINNYKDKWNGNVEVEDQNIKQVVDNYITLSNAINNPTAIESVPLGIEDTETLDVSHLDLLNIASYDFHIARMLGLGYIDLDSQIFNDSYVYIAAYTTFGDLEDGLGAREVQHLSMGLPTAINDERLPLPINLQQEIVPGLFIGNEGEPANMFNDDGYAQYSRLRAITLFAEELPETEYYPPFFSNEEPFNSSENTFPVYAGLEHRIVPQGESDTNTWIRPELSNDSEYLNVNNLGNDIPYYFETVFIGLPENNNPFHVHKQRIDGEYFYKSYGINWFSRAAMSSVEVSIETTFNLNPLIPPTNINSVLIRGESPLMLSSAEEQVRYRGIANSDKTLVRLTFDYHSFQDLIVYNIPADSPVSNAELLNPSNANNVQVLYPDNKEALADDIAIYFRNEAPNNISGKIINVVSDGITSEITTTDYVLASGSNTDQAYQSPIVVNGTESNYIGGSLLIGEQQFIIKEVSSDTFGFAKIIVYNKEISDAIVTNQIPSINTTNILQAPEIINDGFFIAVENMQNATSWGTPNPLALKVNVENDWPIHREIITAPNEDGNLERLVEKTRGIWTNSQGSLIEEVPEPMEQVDGTVITAHNGMYKITFNGIQLAQHSQFVNFNTGTNLFEEVNSVEWYKGIVRVFTEQSVTGNVPNKTRKNLKVAKIENVGTTNNLIVYAYDASFSNESSYDRIQTGNQTSVNFYPGYKVYLYNDTPYGLFEDNILPLEEDVKYTIFGLQSIKTNIAPLENNKSKISVPCLMFAQNMIEALQPEKPVGSLYATRPDFFGRSTYTLTTEYQHKPHGLLFYRTNDQGLLNSLYSLDTINEIKENLKVLGGNNEANFSARWANFLNFEELIVNGDFTEYTSFKFPNPDKLAFFEWANVIITRINENTAFPPDDQISLFNVDIAHEDYGTIPVGDQRIINFVKGAIFNAFVPLTEVPIIYQHIKGLDHIPVNEKQVLKDRHGHILNPSHDDFKMAPMMKYTDTNPHTTQFVDFNLDGTSNNSYFYGVRELSSQMKMGEFSPFLGPIKLVNTNPPEAPEIKRIMAVLENTALGILPSIQIEINAYPNVQNIQKINIYRAFSKLDALSIRTMTLVKTVDIDEVNIRSEAVWVINDDFQDLIEVPFGDGLFYRVTVSREIEYADAIYDLDVDAVEPNIITEYAPSQASKIMATIMVEVNNPPAPVTTYISEPINAQGELHQTVLKWDKTCYKGKYHIYKMNKQGNWVKIHSLTSNEDVISLALADTDIQNHILSTLNNEGESVFYHFKIIAENTSGMFSTKENILTIPNNNIEGIGRMIIGSTFRIR